MELRRRGSHARSASVPTFWNAMHKAEFLVMTRKDCTYCMASWPLQWRGNLPLHCIMSGRIPLNCMACMPLHQDAGRASSIRRNLACALLRLRGNQYILYLRHE